MTPVEATTTSSTGQPAARAASVAISRASASPPSPVAAFAQPAFATIARVRAPARCSRETTTGAACARLAVKTPADGAGRVGHQQREVEAVGLDARRDARGAEAERGGDAHFPRRRRVAFRAPCTGRVTSTAFTSTVTRLRVSARTRSGRPKRRMKPSASWWS